MQEFAAKFDTSKMSLDELKVYINDKLAPIMDKEWGGYEIYRTGPNESLLCYEPYCEYCYGLSEKEGIRLILSEEAIKYLEFDSIVITEKTDYVSDASFIHWCGCDEED